jgi:hypothetical protein
MMDFLEKGRVDYVNMEKDVYRNLLRSATLSIYQNGIFRCTSGKRKTRALNL